MYLSRSMFSAHLDLVPWKGPPPSGDRFGGEGPVLWLGEAQSSGWLEPLRDQEFTDTAGQTLSNRPRGLARGYTKYREGHTDYHPG